MSTLNRKLKKVVLKKVVLNYTMDDIEFNYIGEDDSAEQVDDLLGDEDLNEDYDVLERF